MKEDFKNKDLISITDLTREEILFFCKRAKMMLELEKTGKRYELADTLKNRTLSSMFYEPSTRTRTSFDTAMTELGGKHDGFSGAEGTSVMKKETIRDTIMMMHANHFDAIVMRHPRDGSLQWAADVAEIPVINGGDGKNEHPTQSLLDIFTLYMLNKEKLDGIKIGFGGDLFFGRTVRSLSLALSHFRKITIRWAADDSIAMPDELVSLLKKKGVKVIREKKVSQVLQNVDYYYMTRPQLERMHDICQSDIAKLMDIYRIDLEKIKNFKGKILHPLPVNSEVAEIDYRVFFTEKQAFFSQAENGVFLRKALLYEILKHKEYTTFKGTLKKELEYGNNRLKRHIKKTVQKQKFIDNIPRGIVLDHLNYNSAVEIANELDLGKRGFDSYPAQMRGIKKSFLKTNLLYLKEREYKKIASMSPEHTVNIIKDGEVISKFVYLLCKNENCVTRVITEDVPPKFYQDNGNVRCRYCRTPYIIKNRKVSRSEKKAYIKSLHNGIDRI